MHTWPSISTETIELLLASVTDCEVWNVIWFLRACGETAAEIHLPDLAPSDFHLFASSQEHFAGKWFNTTEEIKAAVVEYFQNLDTEYCCAGLQKLCKWYMKCLDCKGVTWKNREFCHESACIFLNFFGSIVGEKKNVWTYFLKIP